MRSIVCPSKRRLMTACLFTSKAESGAAVLQGKAGGQIAPALFPTLMTVETRGIKLEALHCSTSAKTLG